MEKMSNLIGRKYSLFDYYGVEDVKYVLIVMGLVIEIIEEIIDYLNVKGEKYGLVKVYLYRLFLMKYFLDVMLFIVERICVFDRIKELGLIGELLYLDVCDVFYGKENVFMIIGGRYGLGLKDIIFLDIKIVFDNLVLE